MTAGGAELIEFFLPAYDVRSAHETFVVAPPAPVYHALRRLDLANARTVRWLFRMRGLPAYAMTLDGAQRMGFILLGERADHELALGLVGRFWKVKGDLKRLDRDGFRQFDTPGFAKAVWNFSITVVGDEATRLRTETRVLCLDQRSRRAFRRYWLAVRPFSSWIRRSALRLIKDEAEAQWRKP